jgi:protein involved in polysaccharide export with SLBB domain
MMKISRYLGFSLRQLGFALGVVLSGVAVGAPTPEQLQMFQQLSPEQQAQALKMYQQSSAAPGAAVPQAPLSQPVLVTPRPVETDTAIQKNAQQGTDQVSLKEEVAQKTVKQKLKQFGYDLFAGAPTTFAPATDIPIPLDYVVGPGDTVDVQLFGKENIQYNLTVSRDGQLNFPTIGPISVAGLSFSELKDNLHERIKRQMIGVTASITMGALRSIRVFVLGDAQTPGSYTISALSTMTNALFVSGGIRPIGSLRDIQLKRGGKIVGRLDLYDLLLNGDTSNDVRLQPGDVIFVPPIGATVGVAGEVRRPAIYELKKESTVEQALALAGGMLPTAYPQASLIERISARGERTLVDVDLSAEQARTQAVRDGDVLSIYSVLERMQDVVLLSGHVERPGGVQWREGMKLTDLIPTLDDLMPGPDLKYVVIRREEMPDRHVSVVSARLDEALQNPASPANVALQPRDQVTVFPVGENRAKALEPIVTQLRHQARFGEPEPVVAVSGNVYYPGDYPLTPGMRVSDLVRAAYDVKPMTDLDYALLKREIDNGQRIQAIAVSLRQLLDRSGSAQDMELQPRDQLLVFNIEGDRKELVGPINDQLRKQARIHEPAAIVGVSGLVTAPGQYPLQPGMRISDLVRASGNLTESAYSLGAELTRFEIVNNQYREISHVSIKLADALAGNLNVDTVLQPYDTLNIKPLPEWADQQNVELRGEVRFPGVYPIRRGETLGQLLQRAGGLTEHAFAEGAVFMREDLKQKEQQQLQTMAARLESDLAAIALEQTQANTEQQQSVGLAKSLLDELKAAKPMGRLVINLETIVTEQGSRQDVVLKDGDKLFVPENTQDVTIIGEVQYQTSHLFRPGYDRDDYISLSGGPTYKADTKRIYVVRANGAVLSDEGNGWFSNRAQEIRPGDTIVIPLDAERMRPLTLWTSVTQIIYQLGVAAAAWHTVGVF